MQAFRGSGVSGPLNGWILALILNLVTEWR